MYITLYFCKGLHRGRIHKAKLYAGNNMPVVCMVHAWKYLYHIWYMHGIHQCFAWKYLYRAWNYAWYMHGDLGKIYACFDP
jgi:hypothetical protein